MKVASKNIGYLQVSKNPKYLDEVLKEEDLDIEGSIGIMDFEVKKTVSTFVEVSFTFKDKKKKIKEELARARLMVRVKVSLGKEEVRGETEVAKRIISAVAVEQAWTFIEQVTKSLGTFNIFIQTLPYPPVSELWQEKVQEEKK